MIYLKKYKVCVYAISKNESKFAARWAESMKEADGIYVLDTGSTDNTVEILKSLGVNIKEKIIAPWRFDTARNESLKLVPKDCDICVCTDLDEVFIKGWRKELENLWNNNITRVAYDYNWKLDENNKPLVNFYIEKIHSRNDYIWKNPVHEVLIYIGNNEEKKITTNEIVLNHYPDDNKSRGSYLKLLELRVKECADDDPVSYLYLGREYWFYKQYYNAIKLLKKITTEFKDTFAPIFISFCYYIIGNNLMSWYND